jgi:hypothetical protein
MSEQKIFFCCEEGKIAEEIENNDMVKVQISAEFHDTFYLV